MRKIPAICGPTAVGKTKYAISVAKAFDGEIVSCDSMQLYKYMDIGSAKPTAEEQIEAKHHLVDLIDPRSTSSVAKYQVLAEECIDNIFSRGKLPIIAGGTGLYLNSLIYDMDFASEPKESKLRDELYTIAETEGPEALHERLKRISPKSAERVHPNNIKRVVRAIEAAESGEPIGSISELPLRNKYEYILIGLTRDREELYDRINLRVDILMEQGLLDEIKKLMEMGLSEEDISMKGIGYKELFAYFEGQYDLKEAVRLIKRNTRHFAKRQLTWFKRYKDMKWFNISEYNSDEECIGDLIEWLKNQ